MSQCDSRIFSPIFSFLFYKLNVLLFSLKFNLKLNIPIAIFDRFYSFTLTRLTSAMYYAIVQLERLRSNQPSNKWSSFNVLSLVTRQKHKPNEKKPKPNTEHENYSVIIYIINSVTFYRSNRLLFVYFCFLSSCVRTFFLVLNHTNGLEVFLLAFLLVLGGNISVRLNRGLSIEYDI